MQTKSNQVGYKTKSQLATHTNEINIFKSDHDMHHVKK